MKFAEVDVLLTSALVGGDCSASRPGLFTLEESPPPVLIE
jgi:hypothetical protein